MPYGEILVGAFRLLWRNRKLWGFGLIGLAVGAIGSGVHQVLVITWQSRWYDLMGQVMRDPDRADQFLDRMLTTVPWLVGSLAVVLLAGLLGYLLNLVMRGATIHEAAVAWGGGHTQTGRGWSVGLSRAAHLFAIDALWALPSLLLGCGVFLGSVLFAVAIGGSADTETSAGAISMAVLVLLGCGLCLALLVGVVAAVLSPLMYQSVVVGRRGLTAAVREGWGLARANLGTMIILALLLVLLNLAVSLLASSLTLPFALPFLNTWFRDWIQFVEQVDRNRVMSLPSFRFGSLAAVSLWSLLLSWLSSSLLQGVRLTLYAGVYRRLTGMPRSSAHADAVVPPASPALTVPDEPSPTVDEEPRPRV